MSAKLLNVWSLFSRRSAIDRDTNHLIIGEVIEEIILQIPQNVYEKLVEEMKSVGTAGIPAELELVSLLEGDPSTTYQIELTLTTPSGKVIPLAETETTTGINGRVRNRMRFNALPIGGTGRHAIAITSKENGKKYTVAEAPLTVTLKAQ